MQRMPTPSRPQWTTTPRLLAASFLALLVCSPHLPAQAHDGAMASAHDAWIEQAGKGLDPRPLQTLERIEGAERRLLALRAYLRAGDALAQRWSGTQAELLLYPSTPDGRAATSDLDDVLAAFSAANPGYGLRVNRKPRSLELQIRRWNENPTVGAVASALATALDQRYRAASARPGTADLQHALMEWKPTIETPLAAPGLSAHGQGRAFDFQVEKNGHVIAGPDVALAGERWDAAGWTEKLKLAVDRAGHHLAGPLESPYEPWHYVHIPAATSATP